MTDLAARPAETDSDEAEASTDPETIKVTEAVDAFLAEHDPSSMTDLEFRGLRFDHGVAWVAFPEGHGGLGVRPSLQKMVERRMRDAGAQPQSPATFFMYLAGPTIVTHGSEESKERFLRPMFTGEEIWCQLFSEPGAGSDLAGLACKAEKDGEEWIVNGQKVWNTLAHIAHRGMLVTRTDPDLPKHKGMTYFGVDMKAPGVEVRPLRQITGEAEFNEVYMTDVRVPDSDRIGDIGEGWRASMTTLMNERTAIGGGGGGGASKSVAGSGPIAEALRIWNEECNDKSAVNRDALMKGYVQSEILRLMTMRTVANAKSGNPGPESSVIKILYSNVNQEVYNLCVDLLGPAGQIDYDFTFRRPEEAALGGDAEQARHLFLRVRANSIEGGTSEILKNICGERVLGLPGEPRNDKDVPWIEVPRS